jgi:2'-5' RNA ligase
MSARSSDEATQRLFIAADPPAAYAQTASEWAAGWIAAGMRALPPDQLHVTLRFLGSVPISRADELSALVTATPIRPITVRAGESLLHLPSSSRPRVLALELDSPSMSAIQQDVVSRLREAGLDRDEGRAFRPHLTIVRVARDAPKARPAPVPERLCEPFDAVRIALYRSQTRPSGVVYETLASVDLPPESAGAGER